MHILKEEPDYLKNLPPPTDEEIWDHLDEEYSEHQCFQNFRLETRKEAIGEVKGNEEEATGEAKHSEEEATGEVKDSEEEDKKVAIWERTTPKAYDENIGLEYTHECPSSDELGLIAV